MENGEVNTTTVADKVSEFTTDLENRSIHRDVEVFMAIKDFMVKNNSLSPQVRDLTEVVLNKKTGRPVSTQTITASYKRLIDAGLISIRQKNGYFSPAGITIVGSSWSPGISDDEAIEKIALYHQRSGS